MGDEKGKTKVMYMSLATASQSVPGWLTIPGYLRIADGQTEPCLNRQSPSAPYPHARSFHE